MLKLLRTIYFPFCIIGTALIILPLCLIQPKSYKNTGYYLKVLNYLTLLMGIEVDSKGVDILQKSHPSILIGNHQHNLDICVLSNVFQEKVVALGKKELMYLPFFGLVFWLSGNILINRGNKKSIKRSLKRIQNQLYRSKISVTIFPEGTRNPSKKLLPFKKGAFLTAIQTELPITIFAISRYVGELDLNKWRSGVVKVSFLEPIITKGLSEKDLPDLMEKCRTLLENEVSRISSNNNPD